MRLSPKQAEYVREANRRWNFKGGATRSGKTWLDTRYVIPSRIRERAGKEGLTVLLGVTRATLERNILSPMRRLFGAELVGGISQQGTVRLFGEECWAIGAGNSTGVSRLRGVSVKYAYGDEVAEWQSGVFELLKSRLDRPYSCFDGTYNPEGPGHWLHRFLTSGADVYDQRYTLSDNPFLPAGLADELAKEYRGTVYYERYILGRWAAAAGTLIDTAPRFTKDAALLRDGVAHLDAAYGGKDANALTLGKRSGDSICLYGRLFPGHADTAMRAVLAECRRFSCAPLFCETNADRGYLAREFSRLGLPARGYHERENKYVKISSYLRKWWKNIVFLSGTDEAYLSQILDYTETAEHDDAPDSAASLCRLLDRGAENVYASPFAGGHPAQRMNFLLT